MGTTKKTSIYQIGRKLVSKRTSRPSGNGPWAQDGSDLTKLVVVLEGELGDFKILRKGPLFDEGLMPECLMLHLRLDSNKPAPAIWQTVPEQTIDFVAKLVSKAQRRVAEQWSGVSNEETLTGVLFGGLSGQHNSGGWKVKLRYIEFSKQTKEPGTGADLAIVMEVENASGHRAFKSIWFQAKSVGKIPEDIMDLPRLEDQIEAMQTYTQEAYVLVYSPAGVMAVNPNFPQERSGLDELLKRAMSCRAGDPSVELLGNSLNRKHVLTVLIEKASG